MEIIVAFSYPKKFKIGAKLISWWMQAPYSHVLIYWKSNSLDRNMVYQSSHGSVHFIELNNFLKENNIVKQHVIDLTLEEFNKLLQKAVDLAGQPYDFKGVILLGIYELMSYFGIKLAIKNTKGYFCSELLAELLTNKFGNKFVKESFLIKPVDIDDVLTTNNT